MIHLRQGYGGASTLEIYSPAGLSDLAELAGITTHLNWSVMREMWRGGRTFAARSSGRLIGVAGFYPSTIRPSTGSGQGGAGEAECWMIVTLGASRHLFAIVRHFRLTAAESGYRAILTVCRSEAGKVLARRAGFTFAQSSPLGEIWEWKHSSAAATRPPSCKSRKPRQHSGAASPSSPASRPKSTRPPQAPSPRNPAARS